jgi:hypothetical protein
VKADFFLFALSRPLCSPVASCGGGGGGGDGAGNADGSCGDGGGGWVVVAIMLANVERWRRGQFLLLVA